ncbi:S8/S53 family peptidase [Nocardioides sp. zg-1228]|uniref:S8 family peptidase n=1 Tax=Nocardioides sp. zg-1228 TaxID=2763008 RepID=UPI00164300F8|nr:S8/S53 family peptidase [Nocardioides sp. zg-1228]MBC2931566.1 S8/S53 family peptidase [Nocardioides sp. zg-1228]QSF57166.1 S8/S53 family peptidase [Nocardioides sp. zg-1228]
MAHDHEIKDDARRKLTDQVLNFHEANGDAVAWNTEAPADFTFLFDPDHLLVRTSAVEAFERAVAATKDELLDGELTRAEESVQGRLVRYRLPPRRAGLSLPDVVTELRRIGDFPPGDVTLDHWIHVAPGGGTLCPAIEPEETGLKEPWPGQCEPRRRKRKPVRVSVVDSGWHPPAATDPRTPWLAGVEGDDELNGPDLREYAGHGTFIAGIIRCLAPHTDIYVEGFCIGGAGGGGILESRIVDQLEEALARDAKVINLSAGCRTHDDLPSLAFEVFYETLLKERDCVLVAAAGNDASPAPFWPAAAPWAIGVGSLDHDGRVSSYSNYGVSADVYALGRNIVNAFPDGTFTCEETPSKGDVRVFNTGMARWSGTSFSAPVVAGLIAREIYASGSSAADAAHAVLATSVYMSDPAVGPLQGLRQPYDA